MNVLITGGTGTFGKALTPKLIKAGHDVRIMSRRAKPANRNDVSWAQADIETGTGLDAAMQNIDTVVHLASSPFQKMQEVDVNGTERLLRAAEKAGISHFIYISIIGVDKIPFSYYKFKVAAEKIVESATIPYSILRIAQFHEFIDFLFSSANKLPVILFPTNFQTQPIAAREAAQAVLEAIEGEARGRLPDIAGPKVYRAGEMLKTWKAARDIHRPAMRLPVWGKWAGGFRAGYNTIPDQGYGKITWEAWLESTYGQANSAAKQYARA